MTGVLTPEQPMRKEQLDIVESSWNNSGKKLGTKVLPFGFKYSRMGVDPQAAQMKEQRDFQNQEICRIFGVPPSLVGVQSNTTYSNTEQQAIQFAKYTIAPLTRRIEQEINAKLVYEEDRGTFSARYDMSDLLRGDTAARAAYYTQALNVGWMNRDEVRRAEGLNSIGEGGDVFTVQVNQIALSKLDEYSAKISSNEEQG
jgi:HK97 family phage portal protein